MLPTTFLVILVIFLWGQVIATPEENADLDEPDLFQGDMILPPEERMAAELGMDLQTVRLEKQSKKECDFGQVKLVSSLCPGPSRRHMYASLREKAHTLGFHHEQSRPDRDKYVKINFKNIKSGKAGNFKKYSVSKIDSLGTPYDYDSVMHYGAKAFSANKKATIVPKRRGVTIGQRKGPSPIDIRQMNLLYKCR